MKVKARRVRDSHNAAHQVNFLKTTENENVLWSGWIQATFSKETTLNYKWVRSGQIALRFIAKGKLYCIDFMKLEMISHIVKKNIQSTGRRY